MGWRCTRFFLVAGAASVAIGGAAQAQPRYRVQRIVDRDDAAHAPEARALDDLGRVAGYVITFPGGTRVATLWDSEGPHVLPPSPDDSDSEALGMSSGGPLVGRTYNDNRQPPYHAVDWTGGQIQFLPMPSGYPYAEARAINATGDIIGHVAPDADIYANVYRGAFWHDGQVELIGPDRTALLGINGHRQIVGCTGGNGSSGPDVGNAILWQNGILSTLTPVSSGATGCALAINDAGVVAGRSGGKPVTWQSGSVLTIGPPQIPGTAAHVNRRGEVIGVVETLNTTRQFYRPASGGLYDLRSLIDTPPNAPMFFTNFIDINASGRLLAEGSTPDGHSVTAVLEPYLPSGSDTQPPTITLTSPTTGSYLSDTAVLQASASDNVGVAGVQFFAEGQAVGREVTAPPYTTEVDLLRYDSAPIIVWARARDAAGNVSLTNMKSIIVSNRCQSVTTNQTITGWLGSQTGTFTVRWTGKGTVDLGQMDAGFGISYGKQTYFSGTSGAVLWAPDGELKVRDGDHYPASGYAYNELYYRFRMVVDVPSNRYSVWVRRLNQPEHQLASGYAFRKAATTIDSWMMRVDETATGDALQICNVSAKAGP
jgi:hypothetical protein